MKDAPDLIADRAIWSLVFIGLGTLILANRPLEDAGWWIIIAAVSYGVSAYFLYLLIVRRR